MGEGDEHEITVEHPRMRNCQAGSLDSVSSAEEDVEVDSTGRVSWPLVWPSEFALNSLKLTEKF